MKKFVVLFALLAGCSSSTDATPLTFDGTDPQGSIHLLTSGHSEADIDKFRLDCMVASTGDANLDQADKAVEALPGHVDEAFRRLNGMTAQQIRERAAEIRAKVN